MKLVYDKKLFGIQVVCRGGFRKRERLYGQLDDAFQRACMAAEYVYGAIVDHCITCCWRKFYRRLTAISTNCKNPWKNCQRAVTDGGTIILFSSCHEGIVHRVFYHLADKWRPGVQFTGEEAFGSHKLERVHKINQRIKRMSIFGIADEIPEKVFFSPIRSPQALVDSYFRIMKTPRCRGPRCRTTRY
jgi:nickel-dependent lactate racemase